MASIFGDLQVRYDPWEVGYGDQTPLAAPDEEPDEKVDVSVEYDSASWRPITPPSDSASPPRTAFVDGVMRLESRIQAREKDQLIYGLFGSFAVGAVELQSGSAAFGTMRPFRALVIGTGLSLPETVQVRPGLEYTIHIAPKNDLNDPLRAFQAAMRREEVKLAAELCNEETLVIVDGRLGFDTKKRGEALGYIKRLHNLYLPAKFLPMLADLPAGARTPLFTIQSLRRGLHHHAWFQRLEKPPRGASEMHGIVRLEAANMEFERARHLADVTTVWLPRIAPKRARDPRAPQNLLPIGALERQLRIQLGNAQLFRRWIHTLIAKEAPRV